MIDLDDRAAMRAADPDGMLDLVAGLAAQAREGYRIGLGVDEVPNGEGVTAVAFCGMGGSGVAGDVLTALASPRLRSPVLVVRSTELPEFCGPHTLVVASSYSGDTAETLSLFEEAVRRGCRVIAITSGGRLGLRSDELGMTSVVVPGGLMPRAAFGYLTFGVLGVLERVGLLPPLGADVDEAVAELEGVIAREGPDVPVSDNGAKRLALAIGERVPVVWGSDGLGEVAARRWKTQCNENAKVPAFASVMPELDHNEVVGWSSGRGDGFAVVALRHGGEPGDVAARFAPSLEIARGAGAVVEEVSASGRSPLARLATLVQTGDLVSTYLGIARGVDPSPIAAIDELKRALAGA